jgi:hypothetical protein
MVIYFAQRDGYVRHRIIREEHMLHCVFTLTTKVDTNEFAKAVGIDLRGTRTVPCYKEELNDEAVDDPDVWSRLHHAA